MSLTLRVLLWAGEGRETELADTRDRTIARTQLLRVDIV